jgi:hypothetical protein
LATLSIAVAFQAKNNKQDDQKYHNSHNHKYGYLLPYLFAVTCVATLEVLSASAAASRVAVLVDHALLQQRPWIGTRCTAGCCFAADSVTTER